LVVNYYLRLSLHFVIISLLKEGFILKTLDNIMSKTMSLRNWSTLQIISNILVFIVSVSFIESNTLFATFLVTGVFIAFNSISLFKSIKQRTISFHSYWLNLKLPAPLVVISFITFYMVTSFIFIKFISVLQNAIQTGAEKIDMGIGTIIFFTIYTIAFIVFKIIQKIESADRFSLNVQIDYLIDKYDLDLNGTHFCMMHNDIVSFIIGKYTFDTLRGLCVGYRSYKMSLISEYLNEAGIGFNDLNDGHIQNIEMYGL